jgi:hypothetical protein
LRNPAEPWHADHACPHTGRDRLPREKERSYELPGTKAESCLDINGLGCSILPPRLHGQDVPGSAEILFQRNCLMKNFLRMIERSVSNNKTGEDLWKYDNQSMPGGNSSIRRPHRQDSRADQCNKPCAKQSWPCSQQRIGAGDAQSEREGAEKKQSNLSSQVLLNYGRYLPTSESPAPLQPSAP